MKRIVILAVAVVAAYCVLAVSHNDFGRLAGTNAVSIVRAPSALVVNGIYTGESCLATNDYWAAGWRSLVDVHPQTDSNHYAVATGWENRGDNWLDRVYEVRELPPPAPRRIYKYDLSVAAMEYGEITNLIAFVSADVGTEWLWNAAEILVENDPYFVAATNEVISSGVIGEDKVQAIVERAVELGRETDGGAQ